MSKLWLLEWNSIPRFQTGPYWRIHIIYLLFKLGCKFLTCLDDLLVSLYYILNFSVLMNTVHSMTYWHIIQHATCRCNGSTTRALMLLHLKQVWMWRRLISAWETQMLILTTHCLKWSKMLRLNDLLLHILLRIFICKIKQHRVFVLWTVHCRLFSCNI